ncbi:ABC transporter ATP-binding protein [Altererythrobacter lauratis]|uniref:ABC transporter ATP-binding protein n=1 Tax=Alteraurantiacibacter lauratis TaxID=2054627 RepID=A0ABV7EDJ9_9SPHN
MDDQPILSLRGVTRRYGPRAVVQQASLDLAEGRIACLLGPSGCGKSTILRLIAGLEPVDEGEIRVHGETVAEPGASVPPEQRGIGLVFQDNALFPHLSVRDNVAFGIRNQPAAVRRQMVEALLARFQVGHLAGKFPHTLSGGEQQRVAIARALAREPFLLLLDEPFSSLDGHLRTQVRQSLVADLRSVGTSVLIVTHDPDEAMLIADQLILMAEGRILQSGLPGDCYDNPVSLVAARLLGDAMGIDVAVADGAAQTPFGTVPAPGLPDGVAQLVLRPDDLLAVVNSIHPGLDGQVTALRRVGAARTAIVACDLGEIAVPLPGAPLPQGQAVRLHLRSGAGRIVPLP